MSLAWLALVLLIVAAGAALGWWLYRRRDMTGPVSVEYQGAVREIIEGRYPQQLQAWLAKAPGVPRVSRGGVRSREATQQQDAGSTTTTQSQRQLDDNEYTRIQTVSPTQRNDPDHVPLSIFLEYDVRGLVDGDLTDTAVRQIGRSLGTSLREQGRSQVAIGRDDRPSGVALTKALAKGLLSTGVNVLNLGTVPTPVLYFALHERDIKDGVVVTGSHNGPEYNGLKIVMNGETLWGQRLRDLHGFAEAGLFEVGRGKLQSAQVHSEYLQRVIREFQPAETPLKIVVDCANGATGTYVPFLLGKMGHEVVELFTDPDGSFPNHGPDPTVPENLETLRAHIASEQADLGLAFDGDGDRLIAVDGEGRIIWPDRLLMLFARQVLQQNPGATVVYDIKCSRHLGSWIEQHGGKPLLWKTGRALIEDKMRESLALLGGEFSGHLFFRDHWYGFDDAIYAACRLVALLTAAEQPPVEVFAQLPNPVASPEYRLPLSAKQGQEVIAALKQQLGNGKATISELDGIRADYEDRWGLARLSNTTPCLVVRLEGDNEESLRRISEEFHRHLAAVAPGLDLPF